MDVIQALPLGSHLPHAFGTLTSINNFAAVTASKAGKIESLDEEWHDGHKRQIEIYQWLLRQNGFTVSDTGYWVYANASKDKAAFDWKLEFDLTLVPYTGDDSWVEGTLKKIKECLDSDALPDAAGDCDYCRYRERLARNYVPYKHKEHS